MTPVLDVVAGLAGGFVAALLTMELPFWRRSIISGVFGIALCAVAKLIVYG